MTQYQPDEHRYEHMHYRRCGQSGLKLPRISLGLWHNFGDTAKQDNANRITSYNVCYTKLLR